MMNLPESDSNCTRIGSRRMPGKELFVADASLDHPTITQNNVMMANQPESMRIDVFPVLPPVEQQPLMTAETASELMRLFKVFANDTRLRLLHALVREEELCVTEMAEAVGMKPQAVSNQLQRLVDRGILGTRREGSNIYYRVIDACVPVLLERGLCLIECCPEEP